MTRIIAIALLLVCAACSAPGPVMPDKSPTLIEREEADPSRRQGGFWHSIRGWQERERGR